MARKIGTFITTILMILTTIFQIIIVSAIMNDDLRFVDYGVEPLSIIAFIAVAFTQILFLITLLPTKKIGMILGSFLLIIGIIMHVTGIASGIWIQNGIFVFAGGIMTLGSIFHFIGCIQYRKNNMAGLISGFLFFIVVLAQNLFIAALLPWFIIRPVNIEQFMAMFIIGSAIESILYVLHGLVLSFSKKQLYKDDGAEDMLSVESGDAFASYVPSNKKKSREPKSKKKKEKEEDFSFDF